MERSPVTIGAAATAAGKFRSAGGVGRFLLRYAVLLAMIATFVAFSAIRPSAFLSLTMLKAIPRDMAPLLVVSLGITVVMATNEFDLSFAMLTGLLGTIAVTFISTEHIGMPIPISVLCVMAIGAMFSLISGTAVIVFGASSMMFTIAMSSFYFGLDLYLLHSTTIFKGIPKAYEAIAGSSWGFSRMIFVGLVVLIIIYTFLSQTEPGRQMYATGGNREAARLSGIRVRGLSLIAWAIVGVCCGIAAILISAQAGAANPNSGGGMMLPAFSAVFLGSIIWKSGTFTVVGTAISVLYLQVISTGLALSTSPAPSSR